MRHDIPSTDPAITGARNVARIALEEGRMLSADTLSEAADALAGSGSPLDWDLSRELRRAAWRARLLDPRLLAIAATIVWAVALASIMGGLL